jgi:hypothetical protein
MMRHEDKRHSDKSIRHKPPSKRSCDIRFKRTAIGTPTIALVIIAIFAVAAIGSISIGYHGERDRSDFTTTTTTTTPITTTTSQKISAVIPRDESCISSRQGKQVQWNVAVSAVLSGQVTCVFQSHRLYVALTFSNGTKWDTTEPAIDDIFHVASQCGSPCANMTTATE